MRSAKSRENYAVNCFICARCGNVVTDRAALINHTCKATKSHVFQTDKCSRLSGGNRGRSLKAGRKNVTAA